MGGGGELGYGGGQREVFSPWVGHTIRTLCTVYCIWYSTLLEKSKIHLHFNRNIHGQLFQNLSDAAIA